ncbi:transcriptional regulator GcvA [Variovorax sp. J2P1-59]|uniref:transcriptional regulator GcvA n=1 Tax=Variovorax flavidus TaxID=3053501 RepID=UPI002578761B|nr:transcriptional regulator GcvA [Variovorax sp. J2P1-59]MDM0077977.1 transcriptional regulator GcvA [Variovorax sp. J2P1-59]
MNFRSFPPLGALRAFEAAARHQSVKKAAEELCVTPGAVSQMLKLLESHLDVTLFHRVNRGIRLTTAGHSYLPPIHNAFRQIAEASGRIGGGADTGRLTVSVTPFFASAWLVPRLRSFQEAYPQIDLQIVASTALVNWERDGVDVAVRHGLGRYAGLLSDRVVSVEVVPVAAPALVNARGLPPNPAALASWPKVHDAERRGWHLWFQTLGVDDIGPARGVAFDDAGLLLKAVLAGQGAGLLPAAMIAPDVTEGRLVRLAKDTLLDDFAYYLVYPKDSQARPKVAAFREWILAASNDDFN